MHSINRNSYLHNYFSDVNPRLINRCVDRALGLTFTDVHDLEPPFNRLCSEQPNIPEQNVDIIHRPIGYGKWAMPKLRHDLSDKDECVVIKSIETISELVIDSERAYEAINLNIIDRMVNLLVSENPVIREKTAIALWSLAKLAVGKEVIASNKELLYNISICVEDAYEEVRLHVAKLLQIVSQFWKTADELVEFGYIPILVHILQTNEEKYIILIHLKTLSSLLYSINGKIIALDHDGFAIFLKFIRDENSEILSAALTCLSLLASTCIGEKLAREENLIKILAVLIRDERPEIHTQAASLLMFCTVKATGKIMASKYPKMVRRLIQLAQNRLNPSTQMFAMKALTNICEHPDIRKMVRKEYSYEIEIIQVGDDPDIRLFKETMTDVIGWAP